MRTVRLEASRKISSFRRRPPKKRTAEEVGEFYGYRSGLEENIGDLLAELGVEFTFEEEVIEYHKPARMAKYTPDFVLGNRVIIETKGRFLTADRQKHLLIKEQHPELDIRFLFSNANARISKRSRTTYADWCRKHGFKFTSAREGIPADWLEGAWE